MRRLSLSSSQCATRDLHVKVFSQTVIWLKLFPSLFYSGHTFFKSSWRITKGNLSHLSLFKILTFQLAAVMMVACYCIGKSTNKAAKGQTGRCKIPNFTRGAGIIGHAGASHKWNQRGRKTTKKYSINLDKTQQENIFKIRKKMTTMITNDKGERQHE